MKKTLQIAQREFVATVFTKAFIIGLLVLPAMIAIGIVVGPRLFVDRDFAVEGELAVVDPTGVVNAELRDAVTAGTPAFDLAAAVRQSRAEAAGGGPVLEALGLAPQLTLIERSP